MSVSRQHTAEHVFRAFRYQLLQSISAWFDLGENEELWIEVGEDFAVAAENTVTGVQVKHSETSSGPRPVTLRSSGVQDLIARYWDESDGGTNERYRVVFLANSGATRERNLSFEAGRPGLELWSSVAHSGDTAQLRQLLLETLPSSPVRDWIAQAPSDMEFRERLVQRVQFSLGADDDTSLLRHLNDRLGAFYVEKGHYASARDQGLAILLKHVFDTACAPDAKDRRLTQTDLHATAEFAIPRLGGLLPLVEQGQSIGSSYAVTEVEAFTNTVKRSRTVEHIVERMAGSALTWIQGGHGVGKSTLAGLIAENIGGRWLLCDFRPYASEESQSGASSVWRELMSSLNREGLPSGIVLDDMSAMTINHLQHRLTSLIDRFSATGVQVIICSNSLASPALINSLRSARHSVIDAPYFNEDEVREFILQEPGPPEELLDAWARLVHATTSGGHPLLCAAKIANLRQRSWPRNALLEDLVGTPSAAVVSTREEARTRLLADLPFPDARKVIDRLGSVFSNFEDGLVVELCNAQPKIEHGGDAFRILKGSWIEPVPAGGWRLSPLLSDVQQELPDQERQKWQRLAAEYWLKKRTLDARTLPLCFWNAYLGKHVWVLLKLGEVVLTLSPEELRGAAAMLSPMAALPTHVPLVPEEPLSSWSLRVLQVCVADATENEHIATEAAAALIAELEDAPEILKDLMATTGLGRILSVEQVSFPPNLQLKLLLRFREAVAGLANHELDDIAATYASLESALPGSVNPTGMYLTRYLMRIKDSAVLREMISELNSIDPDTRDSLLNSLLSMPDLEFLWVHNAWSQEQIAERSIEETHRRYEEMLRIVSSWNRTDLEVQIIVAVSVLRDECLDDSTNALRLVDEGISRLGGQIALIRQRAKILRHSGNDHSAANVYLSHEDELAALPSFDRGLAFREGAIACSADGRLRDAYRLLKKSLKSFIEHGDQEDLINSLQLEIALTLWRIGERSQAISTLAAVFENVEKLDSHRSRQTQRNHQYACAIGGAFLDDCMEPFRSDALQSIKVGDASNLQSTEKPEAVELKSIERNWQVLRILEEAIGENAGIAERSGNRNPTKILAFFAGILASFKFDGRLSENDIEGAVALIRPALSAMHFVREARRIHGNISSLEVDNIPVLSIEELCRHNWREMLEFAVSDVILFSIVSGRWNEVSGEALLAAVESDWGSRELAESQVTVSFGAPLPDSPSVAAVASSYAATLLDRSGLLPSSRVAQDLLLTYQVANSLARRILEPAVVKAIAQGWRNVISKQRFALTMPNKTVPEIELALQQFENRGIVAANKLFKALEAATGATIPPGYKSLLEAVEARGSRESQVSPNRP